MSTKIRFTAEMVLDTIDLTDEEIEEGLENLSQDDDLEIIEWKRI